MTVTPKNAIMSVIYIVGLIALVAVGGIIWLASTHTHVPDVLPTVAVGALTAETALLATTRTTPDQPAPPAPPPIT